MAEESDVTTETTATIVFTGRNGAEVRDWVNGAPDVPDGQTWFITKGMTAPTGGQAWRYAQGEQAWGEDVRAAIYDPGRGDWLPVRRGDIIRRDAGGEQGSRWHSVERPWHAWVNTGTAKDATDTLCGTTDANQTRAHYRDRVTCVACKASPGWPNEAFDRGTR
jgi:hypothetical protein